jgi:hypothetical protein
VKPIVKTVRGGRLQPPKGDKMVLSPEELALPKPVAKCYMSHRQLLQGLRKRPGWYGWRTQWGSFTARPAPPPNGTTYWVMRTRMMVSRDGAAEVGVEAG